LLNEPTYVNGIAWKPRWKEEKHDRGKDQSSPYQIAIGTADLDFELLAVTQQRGQTGIDNECLSLQKRRAANSSSLFQILNQDSWYKFVLRKKTKRPNRLTPGALQRVPRGTSAATSPQSTPAADSPRASRR
jgi:hypothetical protein